MAGKNWMLNAKAIAAAKDCIAIVHAELGIRLKLAHPDFLDLLVEYAELNDSEDLSHAIELLAQYAPANIQTGLIPNTGEAKQAAASSPEIVEKAEPTIDERFVSDQSMEQIEYKGKLYPRFRDGMQFRGLYRGQPRYSW